MACLTAAGLIALSINVDAQILTQGTQVDPPNDRIHQNTEGAIRVSTAVPSAQETRKIFSAKLYRRNIQPVWVQVENLGDQLLYLTPMGMDRAYYTVRETARLSKDKNSTGSAVNEHYESRGMTQFELAPYSIHSGYIFTRVDEGTKSFNVDVVGTNTAYTMSFFVPVPGLRLDHYEVDLHQLYPEDTLQHVGTAGLISALEAMPCCVTDKKGETFGDPLNLAFVGEIRDIYYAFMRAGWDETETVYGSSLIKTATSAMFGKGYRYSPVSALYVFGRAQDAALQRARKSIHERNHLRIWLTPLRYEGKPVWVGQISRDIGVHFTRKTITTHKIDPDVDETREFLLEDIAYSQSLTQFGYVGGVGPASYDEPRGNLTGDPYFTDGKRVVMWLSGDISNIDDIKVIDLGTQSPR